MNNQYPKWQQRLEELQLKLNACAVNADWKGVGKYNTELNREWKMIQKKRA